MREYVEVLVGASVESGDLIALLADHQCLGACESDHGISLYWTGESWTPEVLQELRSALKQLGALADCRIEVMEIPDQDWNASWAASLRPVQLGSRIVIRQSWNTASIPEGGFELVIDPKRAFGTGYHATTQLIAEWLPELIAGDERVLDVGTGSGILAMIALRVGAASALGIDNDPEAIECAREYAALNGFGCELELSVSALQELDGSPFDVVLANLDRKTLLPYFAAFRRYLRKGGSLVVSGLLRDDYEEIHAALAAAGWVVESRRDRDEWMALKLGNA